MLKSFVLIIWYSSLLITAPISFPIIMYITPKKMCHEQYKSYVLKQNRKGKRLDKNLTNEQVIKQVWGY